MKMPVEVFPEWVCEVLSLPQKEYLEAYTQIEDCLQLYIAHQDPKIRLATLRLVAYRNITPYEGWSKRCDLVAGFLHSCLEARADLVTVHAAVNSLRTLGRCAVQADKQNNRTASKLMANSSSFNPDQHGYVETFIRYLEGFIVEKSCCTDPFDTLLLIINISDYILGFDARKSPKTVDCLIDLIANCPFEVIRLKAGSLIDIHKIPISQEMAHSLASQAAEMMCGMKTLFRLQAASIWRLLYPRYAVAINFSTDISILEYASKEDRMHAWIKPLSHLLLVQVESVEDNDMLDLVSNGKTIHGILEALQVVFEYEQNSSLADKETMESVLAVVYRAMDFSTTYISRHTSENEDFIPEENVHEIGARYDPNAIAYGCFWRSVKCCAAILSLHSHLVTKLSAQPIHADSGFDLGYGVECRKRSLQKLVHVLLSVRHWGISQHLIKYFQIMCHDALGVNDISGLENLLMYIMRDHNSESDENYKAARQDARYIGQPRITVAILGCLPPKLQCEAISSIFDQFQKWDLLDSDGTVRENIISTLRVIIQDGKLGPTLPLWDIMEKTSRLVIDVKSFAWRSNLVLLFTSTVKRLFSKSSLASPFGIASKTIAHVNLTIKNAMSLLQHREDASVEASLHPALVMLLEFKNLKLSELDLLGQIQVLKTQLLQLCFIFKLGPLRLAAARALCTITSKEDSAAVLQEALDLYSTSRKLANQMHALLTLFSLLTPGDGDIIRKKESFASLMDTMWVDVIDISFRDTILFTKRFCSSARSLDRILVMLDSQLLKPPHDMKEFILEGVNTGRGSWFLSLKDTPLLSPDEQCKVILATVSDISNNLHVSEIQTLADYLNKNLHVLKEHDILYLWDVLVSLFTDRQLVNNSIKLSIARLLCSILTQLQSSKELNLIQQCTTLSDLVSQYDFKDISGLIDTCMTAFSKELVQWLATTHTRCFLSIVTSPHTHHSPGHFAHCLNLSQVPVLTHVSRMLLIEHAFMNAEAHITIAETLLESLVTLLCQEALLNSDFLWRCKWLKKCLDSKTINDCAEKLLNRLSVQLWESIEEAISNTQRSIASLKHWQISSMPSIPVQIALVWSIVHLAWLSTDTEQRHHRQKVILEGKGMFLLSYCVYLSISDRI
ncbi:hypothetical protein BASA50_006390 [Batrachochytrium salamandrivorans]|uniref:DUF2428 domain-containing protein n=1 Tax=Batrachochytrium salamandrivorans TaxID=1357716 RepID=A0ABQ8FBC9_9FUNG|nr:hypothetical protein BASA50_006390 [Batrachochytrium salamandrivorans]